MTSSNSIIDQRVSDLLRRSGFPEPSHTETLRQEASSRSYYRIKFDKDRCDPIVLCKTLPIPSPAHDDFLTISDYFRKQDIPSPAVLGVDVEAGLILQEDGGEIDLTSAIEHVSSSGDRRLRLELIYSAIDLLFQIHRTPPIQPVASRHFDFEKLHWEMEFLYTHMTSALGVSLNSLASESFFIYIKNICENLGNSGPRVFTHRDYHGRNLLVKFLDGHKDYYQTSLTVIDYQDARMGLPWYDLVSLVYDPYTFIPRVDRMQAVAYYVRKSGIEDKENLFYFQALQRLLKALGSYFFLVHEKGMINYQQYIPVVLESLKDIQQSGDLPEEISEFSDNVSEILRSKK